jgi:hypothetical protein
VWGVGCGVWGVGCGVWGVGCGVWGVGSLPLPPHCRPRMRWRPGAVSPPFRPAPAECAGGRGAHPPLPRPPGGTYASKSAPPASAGTPPPRAAHPRKSRTRTAQQAAKGGWKAGRGRGTITVMCRCGGVRRLPSTRHAHRGPGLTLKRRRATQAAPLLGPPGYHHAAPTQHAHPRSPTPHRVADSRLHHRTCASSCSTHSRRCSKRGFHGSGTTSIHGARSRINTVKRRCTALANTPSSRLVIDVARAAPTNGASVRESENNWCLRGWAAEEGLGGVGASNRARGMQASRGTHRGLREMRVGELGGWGQRVRTAPRPQKTWTE